MALPAYPNYGNLAQQQGLLNQQAANRTTRINRPNQTNPFGSLNWSEGADGQWAQTASLNPADQGILDQSRQARGGLMGQVNSNVMGGFNPTLSNFGSVDASAADYSSIPEVQRAIMGGLQPGLDRMRDRDETRLATQGLPMGSRAYRSAQEDISFRENDAERKALLAGVDVSKDLFGRKVDLANLNNQTRSQQMAEALRRRQLPIQEMQALQGAEPQMPNFENFQSGSGGGAPDMYGAAQDEFAAQTAQYNADQAQRQSRRRGLGGLLGTVAGAGLGAMAGNPMLGAQIGSRVGGSL